MKTIILISLAAALTVSAQLETNVTVNVDTNNFGKLRKSVVETVTQPPSTNVLFIDSKIFLLATNGEWIMVQDLRIK